MSESGKFTAAMIEPERESPAALLPLLAALLPAHRALPLPALRYLLGAPSPAAWEAALEELDGAGVLTRDGAAGRLTDTGRARGGTGSEEQERRSVQWIEAGMGVLVDVEQLYALRQETTIVDDIVAATSALLARLPLRVFVNTPGLRQQKRRQQALPGILGAVSSYDDEAAFAQQVHLLAAEARLPALAESALARLNRLGRPHLQCLWQVPPGSAGRGDGHGAPITAIAIAGDEGLAASVDGVGQTLVWSLATGRLHHVFSGPQQGTETVMVTSPGEIITGNRDGTVRIFQLPPAVALPLQAERAEDEGAGVPYRRLFIVDDEQWLAVYDPLQPEPLLSVALEAPLTVLAAAPGGRYLIGGTARGGLYAWRYHEPV